jgi:hypothetical protein
VRPDRHLDGLDGTKIANGGKRHANSKRTADRRQQKTFRQQLAQQPPPSAAQSGTHSQFVLARNRLPQEQVRNIQARDQEDKRHGA